MKTDLRQEKAITLIALVVTIIVLIILAGISLVTISGSNSLINKATDVRTQSDKDEIVQKARLEIIAKVIENRGKKIKESQVRGVLNIYFSNVDSIEDLRDPNCLNETVVTREGNFEVKLSEVISGVKISDGADITIGDNDIESIDDLSSVYGEETNYRSVEGITWLLFYDDDTNIYLIASDYVPGSTLPSELLTTNQYSTYCRSFATSGSDTTSTIPAGNPWKNASTASTVQNNPYLKWVGSSVDTVRTNLNMKAVAFMLDTSKWSNFAGSAPGATATGAPTIEMYALSYNAGHETKLSTYETISNTNADYDGYRVQLGSNGWSSSTSGLDTSSDNMWVKTGTDKATGMWIASPSCDLPSNAIYIHSSGILSPYPTYCSLPYYNDVGFRPIITIPKSSLKQ